MNGLVLFLVAGAAFALTQKENVEAEVTQKFQPDAYTRWDSLFQKYGRLRGVDWMLLKAMAWQESNLGRHPSVVRGLAEPSDVAGSASSDKKSWGLMQITMPTAGDYRPGTTVADLNNPEISVDIASRIVARLQTLFPGNEEYVVRAYNGGPGFLKTARGISDTPIHWAKVKKYLDKIRANGG